MQSGHLSDPGVYKMGDLDSGFTSPVFHRSSSGSKLEMSQSYNYENGGRSPDNHSIQLPLSNSQSFEDLQRLVGVQGGVECLEACRRDPGYPQWHHSAFQDIQENIKHEMRQMLHSRAEVPFRVPLEVNIVLVGFNGDGGYRYSLDARKLGESEKNWAQQTEEGYNL